MYEVIIIQDRDDLESFPEMHSNAVIVDTLKNKEDLYKFTENLIKNKVSHVVVFNKEE